MFYKNIKSKTELEDNKIRLYQEEKTRINKYYNNINKKIDIFYDVQNKLPEKIKHIS